MEKNNHTNFKGKNNSNMLIAALTMLPIVLILGYLLAKNISDANSLNSNSSSSNLSVRSSLNSLSSSTVSSVSLNQNTASIVSSTRNTQNPIANSPIKSSANTSAAPSTLENFVSTILPRLTFDYNPENWTAPVETTPEMMLNGQIELTNRQNPDLVFTIFGRAGGNAASCIDPKLIQPIGQWWSKFKFSSYSDVSEGFVSREINYINNYWKNEGYLNQNGQRTIVKCDKATNGYMHYTEVADQEIKVTLKSRTGQNIDLNSTVADELANSVRMDVR